MADDIVPEHDALDDHPGRRAVLIARREQDGIAGLIRHPHMLEHVALDEHVLGVLQLEAVLHHPLGAAPRLAGRGCRAGIREERVRRRPEHRLAVRRAAVHQVLLRSRHGRP